MSSSQPSSSSARHHHNPLGAGSTATLLLSVAVCVLASLLHSATYLTAGVWAVAQWMPASWSLRHAIQQKAWTHWEKEADDASPSSSSSFASLLQEEIPTVNVQEHLDGEDLLLYLENTYGKDWRRRPLLLRNLWTKAQLDDDKNRRISLHGLLQENLTIPYFTNATRQNALTPDGQAPVREIVANISKGGPEKIGTQFLVQTYPELIYEVAPTKLLTSLWGDYFEPHHVRGTGPFGGMLLPALTTVPVFVASGSLSSSSAFGEENDDETSNDNNDTNKADEIMQRRAYTALHCEPIGNVAVQLSGRKRWILVRPEFSFLIRPSTSPDGRAFFASWSRDYFKRVPTYTAVTQAGDAIWVPTWTWHRVDYIESKDVAIGGSLFHFRPVEFVRNNPLFAFLMLPAMFLELVGYNTQ